MTTNATPGLSAEELHNAIMNLPCEPLNVGYAKGHRDARHAAAELVLAALRPAGPVGWMPIESAPKDGTAVLAYAPGGKYHNGIEFAPAVGITYWTAECWAGPEGVWHGPGNPRAYPTHWQPLPPPPAAPPVEPQP